MKIKKLTVAVSAALVVAYLPAHGEDEGLGGAPEVKLRGFGTIGVVRSTNSSADVMDNLSQPRGAGYSHKWDFGVDSKLAVQADVKFNNMLSASWQVMSQRQSDDTYRPHSEMGFAKLQATPDLNFRLGRLPAPLFMVSEYRKVGYVNPWVRQPNEVYFQVPYNSVDGLDFTYQFSKGDFTGNFSTAAGNMTAVGIPSEGNVNTLKGYQGVSFNFIGEYGPVTFRLGHSRTKNKYTGESLTALYDGLKNIATYGNGNCATPTTAAGYVATYGSGSCSGVAQTIYQRAYSAAYDSILASPQVQQGLATVQAGLPNMEYSSVVDYVLNGTFDQTTADGAKLAQLQTGIKTAIATKAVPAAVGTTMAYNGGVAAGGGVALNSASLQARANEMYDSYNSDKELGTFTGVGIIIDPGTWLLQSEYTIRKVNSFLADTTGWYLTGGYRFGKVMPYISFSELKVDSPKNAEYLLTSQEQAILRGVAASQAGTLGPLAALPYGLLNSISTGVDKTVQSTSYGQKNISLGVRWDLFKSAALKFQWDRIDTEKYARGTMQNYVHTVTGATDGSNGSTKLLGLGTDLTEATDPTGAKVYKTEFDRTKPVNVFSFAVDFVF